MSYQTVTNFPKSILDALSKTIEGYDFQSSNQKNALLKCFTLKTFLPGVKLIEEGSPATGAFLLLEGECKIFSEVNPTDIKIRQDGTITKSPNKFAFRN